MDDEIDWSRRHEADMLDKIVNTYRGFTINLAKRKSKKLPSCVDLDTMISAAMTGLLNAIDKFDGGDKANFMTFATHRIRGAMCDALRNADNLGRIDRNLVKRRSAATEELTKELGRPPTGEEILAKTGWTQKQYLRSMRNGKSADIADKQIAIKSDTKRIKLPIEDSERFRQFARGIDMDGQTLLYLYYYKGTPMAVIAQALGVSKSRVSQKHDELLKEFERRGKEHFLA